MGGTWYPGTRRDGGNKQCLRRDISNIRKLREDTTYAAPLWTYQWCCTSRGR